MNKRFSAITVAILFALSGCGGGSGDSSTSNDQQNNNNGSGGNTQVPPVSNDQSTLLKQFRIADVATALTAATFQMQTWNPTAITRHGDVLYIAHSAEKSQILRYDLKNKKVLPTLNPETIQGILQPWNTISDIKIKKDRLYVSSFPSNRIDVFDLKTETPQFIMALGSGRWWGDMNYAIVHTHAVTANERFVFSPDIENRINVWEHSEIVPEKHLKAAKYARLALPGCDRYCSVRLEAVGNLLYATLGNGNSFVYDVTHLQRGAVEVAPTRQQNGLVSALHYANDALLYGMNNNGAIETYAADQFDKIQQVLPKAIDAVSQYRLTGQDSAFNLAKSRDIEVYQDQVISLVNHQIVMMPWRSIQQRKTTATVNPIQLQQANQISQFKLLQDGESWETLTNRDQRHIFVNQILSATLNRDSIQLQSYSAVPVTDLDIQAKIKGTEQWMVLAKLDRLDAFSNVSLKLKLNDDARFNLVDGTGSIQLKGLSQMAQNPANLFDFKISSATDQHVQKLNKIKAGWELYFGKYNQESDSKWRKITPIYAREWVIMMTNLAYTLSSPEFEHLWYNHKKVMGHDFFGNAGMVDAANGYFKAEDYRRVYAEILNRGGISLGITSMGGGLGGGAVLGVDPWIYYGHYRWSGLGIVAHEFGHHWGSHSSAWANGSYGFQPMIGALHVYLQHQQDLPYLDPNVNKLHLANSADLYGGIDQNIVSKAPGSAPWNKIDQYFADYPLAKSTTQP